MPRGDAGPVVGRRERRERKMTNELPALAEADAAMAAHEAAKASGDVVAVGAARGRLLRAKDALARLKVERESHKLMKVALAAQPFVLGLGWAGAPPVRKIATKGNLKKVYDGRGNLLSVRLAE